MVLQQSFKWPLIIFCTVAGVFVVIIATLLIGQLRTPDATALPAQDIPVTNTPIGQDSSLTAAPTGEVPASVVRPGLPVRLKIPKIGVDAAVGQVSLTKQGAMDVPTGPQTTAWLNIGPRPGELGSAAIAGHFGWKDGIPAVFDNLHKLKVGDRADIVDEKGVTIRFVVREIRTFGPSDDAQRVFNSSDGQAHLNLITCQGSWNKSKQSYSKRLVVFTDKL